MKKKEMKKIYRDEMIAVEEVINTLSDVLISKEPYTSHSEHGVKVLTREEFLESMIEWSIDYLGGNVNYMFLGGKSKEV